MTSPIVCTPHISKISCSLFESVCKCLQYRLRVVPFLLVPIALFVASLPQRDHLRQVRPVIDNTCIRLTLNPAEDNVASFVQDRARARTHAQMHTYFTERYTRIEPVRLHAEIKFLAVQPQPHLTGQRTRRPPTGQCHPFGAVGSHGTIFCFCGS